MIPYKWPVARAVPQSLQARLEIAKAIRVLAETDDEALRQRRAEIASIQREWEAIRGAFSKFCRDACAVVPSELRKHGYNPEEPRVPKRNTGGGEWTRGTSVAGPIASALIIKHPGAYTGDPRIDDTTDKLVDVLEGVIQTVSYPESMTPQLYGQLVHREFAKVVKAAGIEGIGPNDVETTFPQGPYGSPGSIRTDVVLRDHDGNIKAIYDVKTGEADLTPARAAQLRAKTDAPLSTAVIQVRFNEAVRKRTVG